MNMKTTFLTCFMMAAIFTGLSCSKAPIPYVPPENPDAQERIVLAEFFTQDN